MVFTERELKVWQQRHPLLSQIIDLKPVSWLNPNLITNDDSITFPLDIQNMEEAEQLWKRFAPFLAKEFPETREAQGMIESPLKKIEKIKNKFTSEIAGDFYLKCDNELPVAGSIKARGGFFEVLSHAEKLAIEAGLISIEDNYEKFSDEAFKRFFNQYSIGVGSTGNLGLSIGIISAKLGFNVSAYMSSDAKEWKKELLREKGVIVQEYAGDFSKAIHAGREKTKQDPKGYFVDDEDSELLFLGYSTAALRLEKQLKEQQIRVDKTNPLIMYLPCGVGGSPGGITFGLKQIFGEHVHCFFVEPTHSPSQLIGLLTEEKHKISVQHFGIDNLTEADGLAVGRPSSFATDYNEQLISGIYTIEDNDLYKLLTMLADSEGIYLEPSATAGLLGPSIISQTDNMVKHNIDLRNATHIVWATGGSLVPESDMEHFYERGRNLLMEEGKV